MDTMFLSEALEHYQLVLYTRSSLSASLGISSSSDPKLLLCERAIKRVQELELEGANPTPDQLGEYRSIVTDAVDAYHQMIEAQMSVAEEAKKELSALKPTLSLVRN